VDEEMMYARDRQRMVDEQLVERHIRDERVLQALREVPRHRFVPAEYRHMAYSDGPLPIGSGQTISQPYIVALMTQLLRLKGDERVLEVGTGSGYQAAVLAHLAQEVHTIERHTPLAESARAVLQELNLSNVHVHIGDGSLGLPELAPFQGILVTAAAPEAPKTLLEQLDQEGRLVVPVGGRMSQFLERWERRGASFEQDVGVPVAFVPLRGKYGWKEDGWEIY
jgi:protein-L-isoaspartate(D-aspartate) O-methyltransferase